MALSPRPRPKRLAEKLRQIRESLGLTQDGLVAHLGLSGDIVRSLISRYERGTVEPPLPVLLKYARAANLYVDVLIDDDLDLPQQLPSPQKHEGIRRPSHPSSKRKVRQRH